MTNMQRVFGTLQASPDMLPVWVLTQRLGFTTAAVENALRGLRRHKCVRAIFNGKDWCYGIREGVRCPDGFKGRKRANG